MKGGFFSSRTKNLPNLFAVTDYHSLSQLSLLLLQWQILIEPPQLMTTISWRRRPLLMLENFLFPLSSPSSCCVTTTVTGKSTFPLGKLVDVVNGAASKSQNTCQRVELGCRTAKHCQRWGNFSAILLLFFHFSLSVSGGWFSAVTLQFPTLPGGGTNSLMFCTNWEENVLIVVVANFRVIDVCEWHNDCREREGWERERENSTRVDVWWENCEWDCSLVSGKC